MAGFQMSTEGLIASASFVDVFVACPYTSPQDMLNETTAATTLSIKFSFSSLSFS